MSKSLWPYLLALGVAVLSAFTAVAAAQTRPKIPPPDFTREYDVDAAGLRQWKAFDVACPHCKGVKVQVCEHCKGSELPICLECDMKKRTTCRPCGGKGKLPDPLVELACPFCWGSAWYPCGQCNSWGSMQVEGAKTKCGACKEKGLLKCLACNAHRRVDAVKVAKKSVGEATAKDLREVLERLRATLVALEKYEPESNPSRAQKAFAKVFEPLERDLKVVKDMDKMLEEVLKGIKSFGAGYTGFQERLTYQFLVFKDRAVFLLQHQIRAAEQSLERAEFNEAK